MDNYDVVVVGGGPAGMSAALSAFENGAKNIVIIERDHHLGGILQQCIHSGFGLHKFKMEMTGPEYGEKYEKMLLDTSVKVLLNTLVVDISPEKVVTTMNAEDGIVQINGKSIVLAMGCREKSRGALSIPGDRPAGVFSAGTAQKFVNIMGYLPGKEVAILGSGDIGLIMARRMTLEGAKVKAVCEIMKDSGGLTRNIVQCLQDFDIPLMLNHTVCKIHGKERVEGVTIAQVDENLKIIPDTKEYISCDTLLLSVGLIPENELSKKAGVELNSKTRGPVVDDNRQTSVEGIFACGNVVKVHELVDFVSQEGEVAGKAAALYSKGHKISSLQLFKETKHQIQKKGVSHLSRGGNNIVICTNCPNGCEITAIIDEDETISYSGNLCKIGENYAKNEITKPSRILTTTAYTSRGTVIPVKSNGPLDKKLMFKAMAQINRTTCNLPIKLGDIIIKDILGSGVDIIASKTIE